MSILDSIERQLVQRFADPTPPGRVIIWSDPEREYESQVDLLTLPGVTVLHVDRNEFALKRRVLATEPKAKFLVYRAGPTPADLDNWLLDLDLAFGVFEADRASLVMHETGVPREVAERYPAYFDSAARNQALKARIGPDDDPTDIAATMIALLIGIEDRSLGAIWRALLTEHAHGRATWIGEIVKLGLADFHWAGTRDIYGYASPQPSVEDFTLWLFARAWDQFASTTPGEFRNIQRDFSMWANDGRFAEAFPVLADRAADRLRIGGQVAELDLAALLPRFTFRQVDEQILRSLAEGVRQRTIRDSDVQETARRRAAGPWYATFADHYRAVAAASVLLTRIDSSRLGLTSPAEGVRRYADEWYAVDQAYRTFTWHAGQAEPTPSLEELKRTVEAFYATQYLKPLGDEWSRQVDALAAWPPPGVAAQTSFFADRVQRPFLDKGTRVAVIVSDALRYEVAEELGRRLRQEDRFEAALTPMVSTLPSYTQLGMAALLPHESLAFAAGDKALVEVDGAPSDGTEKRAKILAPHQGSAISATAWLALSQDAARERAKAVQVLYVYHNRIDLAGDKATSETTVFDEAEATIVELIKLAKKLANANVSNIVITADHGFLYQETPLEESEYLSVKPHGDKLLFTNHRFVLGLGLKRDNAFVTFTPAQLGMAGEIEAQVPKSIHRLRLPGSGVRYVHGGATLQEVVLPVLAINKKRASDTRQVAVKPMAETDKITTGQITVLLYQEEPVTDKVKGRSLIAGLWVGDVLISNEVAVACTQQSAEQRDRIYPVRLVLSKEADDFNGRTVELRLYEQVSASQRARYPDVVRFTLLRTFTSDFDF
ncbi:MAG: BREX-1 system phosphatase PglZ type A [Actinomycetia bacterium]|nr:BREX-1 system phosphatase PglZ type A [Actinomycetes bacterium]